MPFSEIAALIRLGLGALATFLAILFWSKTRDGAWMMVIMAVIITYAEIVFSTLQRFGILAGDGFQLFGMPGFDVIQVVLTNLPLLLIGIAFLILVARRRIR